MKSLNKYTVFVLNTLFFVGSFGAITIEDLEKRVKFLETQLESTIVSPCDNWTRYKDIKCIKIYGIQTYNETDAKKLCANDGATLLSIHSDEEMQFLSQFIFKDNHVVNDVWIGAERNKNAFKWNDGSAFTYTNWKIGFPTNESERMCVQIHNAFSFFESSSIGKWIDTVCNKTNIVVCQKKQKWSFQQLKNDYVETRENFGHTIDNLIPIGFVYVQLPGKNEPKLLWNQMNWRDVSEKYSGLFFRVNGENSTQFGVIQEQNSPRLIQVNACDSLPHKKGNYSIKIPDNGKESDFIYTGDDAHSELINSEKALKFIVSKAEVRPRNIPIKVWERIN